jgi:arginyl-tRNA synthetase
MILRQAPGGDIIFDPEKSLSLEGDSGPYLQYALVRAKSVVKQAGAQTRAGGSGPEEPYLIEKIILHYPEVVTYSVRKLAPNLLVNYLTELAGEWNSFYAQERIVGGDYEAYKLLVARAFVQTMTNGLTLLGIPTPERM